jgi:hypothetical protein
MTEALLQHLEIGHKQSAEAGVKEGATLTAADSQGSGGAGDPGLYHVRVRVVWVLGLVAGLVAGGVVLAEVPLFVKLLIGLAVVVIGVAGPLGSVVLAGLLLGAGLLTFVGLLVTSDPAAVGASLGVATLLIASGVAFSFRELFRNRTKPPAVASPVDTTQET